MKRTFASLAMVTLVVGACSSTEAPEGPAADAGPGATPIDGAAAPDAATADAAGTTEDYGPCGVPFAFGDLGAVAGEAEVSDALGYIHWKYYANPDPDHLWIELYRGTNAFPTGFTTGTFELTGPELFYAQCGVCVGMRANRDSPTQKYYFAVAGTVTLTSVEGRLTGSIDNLTLQHVDFDLETEEVYPVGDGCVTSVEHVEFDTPIMPR